MAKYLPEWCAMMTVAISGHRYNGGAKAILDSVKPFKDDETGFFARIRFLYDNNLVSRAEVFQYAQMCLYQQWMDMNKNRYLSDVHLRMYTELARRYYEPTDWEK